MIQAIFIWWLTAQAFGIAGLPLTLFFFRALPDRGYAFSKVFGLLLSGYLAWLLAMLGLAPFGRALLIVCALAVAGLGWLVYAPYRAEQPRHWTMLSHWRRLLAYEVAFLLALLFMVALRSYNYEFMINPNPWGTERPMDYALFNAIRNSSNFPPHDPWLAGYSINYYYFGYLLMAAMSLVSGVDQVVAYNLALALIFALTALGIVGVVSNLMMLTIRSPHMAIAATTTAFGRLCRGRLGQAAALLLTVVVVLFAGNEGGLLEIVTGTPMVLALDGHDLGRAIINGLGARQTLTLEPPFKGWDFDGTSEITPVDMTQAFNWWSPSRAVWDAYRDSADPSDPLSRRYTITEFPFFSFWLGDMHPHVMALPFGLLALALALHTVVRRSTPHFAQGRQGWAELILTGVTLGSLYLINSWDLPSYVLLFLGALVLLYVRLGRTDSADTPAPVAPLASIRWAYMAKQALLALLFAWLLFMPFHLTFRSLVGGKAPLLNVPVLATLTRTLGIVTASRTPLQNFLIIFGLMLLPLLAFVYVQIRRLVETSVQLQHAEQSTLEWRWLPLALLGVLVLGILIGFPLLVLLPLAIYTIRLALIHSEQPVLAFVLWVFALVCLICFGTEIVYIRDVFEGGSSRMNTIFKFYYQAWLMWGVLAGYAVWWLMALWPKAGSANQRRVASSVAALLVGMVCVALLAGALVYPWFTAVKGFRTGEYVGMAGKTKREENPDEAAAIDWLRSNANHAAVVLEASGGDYDTNSLGYGQVSGSTGLATVLGWRGHEEQWRAGDPTVLAQLGPREEDVKAIYSPGDVTTARALLQKYGVNYIYVGAAENASYPVDLGKLAQLGTVAFQQGNVVIYQVTSG